jgi:glutathione synthase/RimK-type ligase-like ATP-grasp enzyme
VLLLTAASLPAPDLDTAPLVDALGRRRVRVSVVDWSRPFDWPGDADLAVVRSTWDYTVRRDEFVRVLGELSTRLANPAAVIGWNSHKSYLVELSDRGVPVVPTVLVRRGDPVLLPALDAPMIVLKRAVSAGARGIGRFAAGDPLATEHLAALTAAGDALVQPFEPTIGDGERSLMFFGGEFSHAVRKVAADGDFRVQTRHGGRNLPHVATGAELRAATLALSCVDGDLLYARVDMIGTAEAPLVMELELIEPEVFLPTAAGAADRFGDAIVKLL